MRALVVYASWFGHNRTVARRIAQELEAHQYTTVCAPISQITPADLIGCDLLVLGSYTHTSHASKNLHALIDNTPLVRLQRMEIGLFGVRTPNGSTDGIDELMLHLAQLDLEPAVAPLRINLRAPDFLPQTWLGPEVEERIVAFADELAEVGIAA
ncbi:MAG TPA: hypothetical protein PKA05_01955 [Roseiflexaceae bacterium]|nr:hypothetical protein [Roseiflexaceae bacterium]HMP39119.1 hypothetical protein [Roseiflexaceae bacterium]